MVDRPDASAEEEANGGTPATTTHDGVLMQIRSTTRIGRRCGSACSTTDSTRQHSPTPHEISEAASWPAPVAVVRDAQGQARMPPPSSLLLFPSLPSCPLFSLLSSLPALSPRCCSRRTERRNTLIGNSKTHGTQQHDIEGMDTIHNFQFTDKVSSLFNRCCAQADGPRFGNAQLHSSTNFSLIIWMLL
jgi:hypothetical protein